jgi:hypothetical protein
MRESSSSGMIVRTVRLEKLALMSSKSSNSTQKWSAFVASGRALCDRSGRVVLRPSGDSADPVPWFERLDLRDADFRGLDLSGAHFWWCDLSDATFEGACLYWSSFARCTLERTDFSHADMRGVILDGVVPRSARLRGADLSHDALGGGSNLRRADLSAADLSECSIDGARYDEATRLPPGIERSKLTFVPHDPLEGPLSIAHLPVLEGLERCVPTPITIRELLLALCALMGGAEIGVDHLRAICFAVDHRLAALLGGPFFGAPARVDGAFFDAVDVACEQLRSDDDAGTPASALARQRDGHAVLARLDAPTRAQFVHLIDVARDLARHVEIEDRDALFEESEQNREAARRALAELLEEVEGRAPDRDE